MDIEDFLEGLTFIVTGLIIIFMLFLLVFIQGIGVSEGQHTGYVTAVEYNSNLIWDSEIAYFKTDLETTQEDKYCISNDMLKQQLQEYAKDKTPVTIYYKNNFIIWRSQCSGGTSIIVKVDNELNRFN